MIESSHSLRWSRIDWTALVVVVLIGLATRALTINRPFERDPEGCGCFYGTLARNYLRHEVLKNFAVPIQSIGVSNAPPIFYPNHPPLVPLLIAGVYRATGWNPTGGEIPPDWQTRLPTTCFTLACIAMIFALMRNRASLRAAAFSAAIFALLPITILFGSQPDVINTQLVFFALLTVIAYERFHRTPSIKSLTVLCLAFLPAAMTDWPAFYFAPVLGLHFVFTRKLREWIWIISFGIFAVAIFAALYMQAVAVTHDWHWMTRLVERRASSAVADNQDVITVNRWMRIAIFEYAIKRHGIPIIALSLIWIAMVAKGALRNRSTLPIALLLCWCALHVAIGRQGVFVHEWWWWPLSAGVAMSAGAALDFILLWIERRNFSHMAATSCAIALLIILGAYNFHQVAVELDHPHQIVANSPENYSITEIGDAIRAAVPFNRAVMLAENDPSLGLWFYADRPLKQFVWDPETFEKRRADSQCDLQFGLSETWREAPVAMLVPKAYLTAPIGKLFEYLDARFPKREIGKFIVYQLK